MKNTPGASSRDENKTPDPEILDMLPAWAKFILEHAEAVCHGAQKPGPSLAHSPQQGQPGQTGVKE